MTVLTPTEEGVKVFTLPEEPRFSAWETLSPATQSDCQKKIDKYHEALAQAKSSAILVKDQDEAWRMIFPELKKANHIEVKDDIIRYKHPNTKFYDHILINYESLYPIPGLKYTVEKIPIPCPDNKPGCLVAHFKQVAILSLEEEKKEPVKEVKHTPLLPCPFCNTQPEWINEALPDDHFYIRCPHCHIVMKEDRRDKVIGMWNRRQSPVSDGETQEELCEKLVDMRMNFGIKEAIENFTIQRKVKQ